VPYGPTTAGNGLVGQPARPEAAPAAPGRYFNRDLSWLDFNRRVLEFAAGDLPLLERVKLFAIVASNLDEFFAVRVAALERMAAGIADRFPDGRTPAETLSHVHARVVALQAAQDRFWLDDLQPALALERIRVAAVTELCQAHQLPRLRRRFRREIEPLLTPIGVGPGASLPRLESCALNLAVVIEAGHPRHRFVHVSVPSRVPRFVEVCPGVLVALEDAILHFLPRVLGGRAVEASAFFRITRDADLSLTGDEEDFMDAVSTALHQRRAGAVVRVETNSDADCDVVQMLKSELGVDDRNVYQAKAPLGLRDLFQLSETDRPNLKNRPWRPLTPPPFADKEPTALLSRIRRGPLLVHHPYHSFDSSVVAFASAARESDVGVLKATVYRTGDSSGVLASLIETAAEGKQAVAFVELKARFDEERNVTWVRRLLDAGVDVVYGVPNLKVHAKLALLVRQEGEKARRYVHIGTGNYHACNAGRYEDLSLFTADEAIAADVADVFNALTGQARPRSFRKLLVGPWFLRDGLLTEIERVTRAVAGGQHGRIRIKVNSLVDPQIVDALYAASQAGATVELVTRGICALRPGVPGTSDRITVRSVLGRFLEHSRIFIFEAGDRTRAWIGSADLMPRNLDDRVEVLAPVEGSELQGELSAILDALMSDTRFSWELESNGDWHRRRPASPARPLSAQELLMARASAEFADASNTGVLRPHSKRKESHVRQLVH
jgi:polyphosphate kinase